MRSKKIILNITIILSIFFTITNNIIAAGAGYNRSSYDLTKELRVLQKFEGELLDHRMSAKKNITDSNRILFRGSNGSVIIIPRYKVNNIIDRIILIAELTGLDGRIIKALPSEYITIINFARTMGTNISKLGRKLIWVKINSTQAALHIVERKRIRAINEFLESVRSRVKRILIERKRSRIIEDQPYFSIKGLWRKSDKIEIRFRDEFNGYYEKVLFLKKYNFKKGDLGYRVKKIDSKTYKLDIKFCWTNKTRPCYWKYNYKLKIIDNNTMKESSGLIWKRVSF